MKAIVQHGYGDPERVLRIADIPRPEPRADEVLVRMRASSVNTPDWIVTTGTPAVMRIQAGLRTPKVWVRGTDVAGVVEAVGSDVTDLSPGEEVFGSAWAGSLTRGTGTFAEYALAPAAQLIRKPAFLSFEEAASAVMSGVTALIAIRDVAEVGPGSRVLINGASGGVGTFAVQIAAALGAEVTGVCSGGNAELVRELGAVDVIDHTAQDFTAGDRRYDVVLDNVLNHPARRTARVLDPGGVLIPNSVGPTDGPVRRLLGGLPRMGIAAVLGRLGTPVTFASCEVDHGTLTDLLALMDHKDVHTVIDRTYELADTAAAVRRMLTHRARGNIAIRI